MRIQAFRALRPPAEIAGQVASAPYDVVTTDEARAEIARNPRSFLRVVRAEADLPAGVDPYAEEAYARAATNFAAFRREGLLVPDDAPHLYVYRLTMGRHTQHGLTACVHIEDYENNVIRRHELTREDKRRDRIRVTETLGAHAGLVFMAYRDSAAIDHAVAAVECGAPLLDFTAGGVRHTVWRAPPGGGLEAAFRDVPVCYIADGHHRADAAFEVGRRHRSANAGHTGAEEYNWFPAALFPAGQLQILPYHRCVKDLNGLTPARFMDACQGAFDIIAGANPAPDLPGRFSMYLGGTWHALVRRDIGRPARNPLAALDVSYLQDQLLAPVLGIRDPRQDRRIEFVGGIRGPAELARQVDAGAAAVAFSLHPVTVWQMLDMADAGLIMPPKSTWFEPKLKSGLLVHEFGKTSSGKH